MRINTNISAIQAYNNLSKVQDQLSSSMQKLSSGFRINNAGDDAAGLGIANQLGGDIAAMNQASNNADQAGSVLQIMDGATQSIQSILETMKQLAAESASDTVDSTARAKINQEFQSLSQEIDRTVQTTQFQGQNLLDGSFGGQTVNSINASASTFPAQDIQVAEQTTATGAANFAALASGGLTVSTSGQAVTYVGSAGDVVANASTTKVSGVTMGSAGSALDALTGGTYTLGVANVAGNNEIQLKLGTTVVASTSAYASGNAVLKDSGGNTIATLTDSGSSDDLRTTVAGQSLNINNQLTVTVHGGGSGVTDDTATLKLNGTEQVLNFNNHGINVTFDAGSAVGGFAVTSANNAINVASTKQAQFLVSASQDFSSNDLINLDAVTLDSTTLGVSTSQLDLSTAAGAQSALTAIDGAITSVGTALGSIGAAENRISYASSNVKTSIQNYTAAESTIKDVDMASEMTNFSKEQIMVQAGTAMLAQANQLGSSVLKLFQ